MKFKFNGTIDDLKLKYSDARDKFNKTQKKSSLAISVFLRGNMLEVCVERAQSGNYFFTAPIVERDGYLELEADIIPDRDMKMRWYDWVCFSLVFVVTLIPMLIACAFTKSSPFGTKKKRTQRLRSYMCEYLECEEL